jgi:hypothetical protein
MNDPFGTFDTDQERARRVQFTAELLRVADDAARSNSVESWTPVTEMLMESTVLLPIAHAGNEAPIQENAASVPIVVNDDGEYLLPVFTDEDELVAWQESETPYGIVRTDEVLEAAVEQGLPGVVVNPAGRHPIELGAENLEPSGE